MAVGGVIFLLLIVNTILHAIKMVYFPISVIYSMRYNSPMTMLMTIVVFNYMMTWKIKSKFINKVARSVFSVYIISEMMPVYYQPLHWIQGKVFPKVEFVCLAGFIVFFFISCLVIDQLRIKIQERISSITLPQVERLYYHLLLRLKLR